MDDQDRKSARKALMPVASITMSSSSAAATAMPSIANVVRAGCRRSVAEAIRNRIGQRPMSDKGDDFTSRQPAAAPEPMPSTSERPVANAKICGVSSANTNGVRYSC
mgnify:CR=1 FL=1